MKPMYLSAAVNLSSGRPGTRTDCCCQPTTRINETEYQLVYSSAQASLSRERTNPDCVSTVDIRIEGEFAPKLTRGVQYKGVNSKGEVRGRDTQGTIPSMDGYLDLSVVAEV